MRRNLVAGNWKMNGDRAMAAALCARIVAAVNDSVSDGGGDGVSDAEVVLCPPHILIPAVIEAVAGSNIVVGAQDLDANDDGAFTGQVSARMIRDSGCRYVIVGHSERRALYDESDQSAARKAKAALDAGLRPIVCLGETAAQREGGETEAVIARQLDAVLDATVDAGADFTDAVLAYEPVWAIGTGATATPAQAQQAHRFIRARLAARDARAAASCRILYGGSMKPDNAAALIAQDDIDGGLIGGASLDADDFLAICTSA
ncbi:MAG: triose-phosphate isomerase [bacterium]